MRAIIAAVLVVVLVHLAIGSAEAQCIGGRCYGGGTVTFDGPPQLLGSVSVYSQQRITTQFRGAAPIGQSFAVPSYQQIVPVYQSFSVPVYWDEPYAPLQLRRYEYGERRFRAGQTRTGFVNGGGLFSRTKVKIKHNNGVDLGSYGYGPGGSAW
jgi:hypothetical protein